MRAGTIVASNYVAMAQVLAESFLAHHPESEFAVLVIDDGPADLPDPIRVVRLADLDLDTSVLDAMKTVYDVMEFATSVKPAFLAHLLDAGPGGDTVACYLDPDIVVYQPFDDQVAPALAHGIVLTPHVLSPVPRDGKKADELTIMQSGMYNCGFLAVSERARDFLDWWDVRLRFDAVVDFERASFTDQRWVDWVPSLFDFHISRDPGMNVAWWNIHERPVDVSGAVPTVLDRPVRFVHFSGYDPAHPDRLSKHQEPAPRVRPEPGSGIRALADEYAERLRACGHDERRRQGYQWDVARDGTPLTREVRRLVRDALLDEIERLGERSVVPDAFGRGSESFGEWVTGATTHRLDVVAAGSDDEAHPEPAVRATYDVAYEPGGVHERIVALLVDRFASAAERGTVVDLGCGFAPHAEPLAAEGFGFVGVDANAESVAALSERGVDARVLDLAADGELESLLGGLGTDRPVAAVLLLDVLEHLVDPHLFLERLWQALEPHPQAVVVTSVPNVSHVAVAAKLLAGRWDVTPTGLLDRTHLRFFTSVSLTAMFESASFVEVARRDRPAIRSDQHWPERSPFVAHGTPLARFLTAVRARADDDAHTYQFVRMYARAEQTGRVPTLVMDPGAPSHVVSVVVAGGPDARIDEVRRQLDAQTSDRWELIAAGGIDTATMRDIVASARGELVAFPGPHDDIASDWVGLLAEASRGPSGDPNGAVVRTLPGRDGGTVETTGLGAAGSYAFPLDALRALRPAWDRGTAAGVGSLLLQLVAECGLSEVSGGGVTGPSIDEAGDLDADVAVLVRVSEGEPVLSSTGERRAHVEARRENEALRRRVAELDAEMTRLRSDAQWFQDELSALPVRVVRRLARRSPSAPD